MAHYCISNDLILSLLDGANEVISLPYSLLDIPLQIYLFSISMLPIILPLTYIVKAIVYDSSIAMSFVIQKDSLI
jgi:hypothetical protein